MVDLLGRGNPSLCCGRKAPCEIPVRTKKTLCRGEVAVFGGHGAVRLASSENSDMYPQYTGTPPRERVEGLNLKLTKWTYVFCRLRCPRRHYNNRVTSDHCNYRYCMMQSRRQGLIKNPAPQSTLSLCSSSLSPLQNRVPTLEKGRGCGGRNNSRQGNAWKHCGYDRRLIDSIGEH